MAETLGFIVPTGLSSLRHRQIALSPSPAVARLDAAVPGTRSIGTEDRQFGHKYAERATTFFGERRTHFQAESVRTLAGPAPLPYPVRCMAAEGSNGAASKVIRGTVFVILDNIDTDQIIPAEYLTLVPSKPDEYEQLGKYALIGLPDEFGRYVEPDSMKTKYSIIVAGENFGCGSSREHAPIALGAAGCDAVVAQSYARIFFRNCTATGELYPWECVERLCDVFKTGDDATIDFATNTIINHRSGEKYALRSLGDVGPVIDAGGLFEYARRSGMIKSASS